MIVKVSHARLHLHWINMIFKIVEAFVLVVPIILIQLLNVAQILVLTMILLSCSPSHVILVPRMAVSLWGS